MNNSRNLNIPNLLSSSRLLAIPVFIYTALSDQLVISCIIIFYASFTDWLDGFIARKYDQSTRLGQILDPISDRLYILSLILVIFILQLSPIWILIYLISREVILSLLLLYLKAKGITGLPVHYLGKMGAFCLLIGLPGLIFAETFTSQFFFWHTIGWGFLVWGVYLYAISGYKYFEHAFKIVRTYG